MSFLILFEEFRKTGPIKISDVKTGSIGAGFDLEREFISELRTELTKVLNAKKSGFWSIKDPKLEYQATWIQEFLEKEKNGKHAEFVAQLMNNVTVSSFMKLKETSDRLANPRLIASVLKEIAKNKFFSAYMYGQFGAEFGDIIFSKNVRNHSPKYNDVKIFLDTKNTKKSEGETLIALRSIIRFGTNSRDNQPKLYLVRGPGYIYVFFLKKSAINQILTQLETDFPGIDLSKLTNANYNKKLFRDLKSTGKHKDLENFGFMTSVQTSSANLGVKVSYMLKLLGKHKNFKNLTEASVYILNLLNYLEKKQ